MVDTHAHLAVCEPPDDELVAAAREAGVRRILTIGLEEETNRAAIEAAERYPEVFAALGRHPNSTDGFGEQDAREIEEAAAHPRVVAIGETGLDFYREGAAPEVQLAAFRAQIGIARRTGLPLVVHMRDADEQTFRVLRTEAEGIAVVLHCFSAPPERVPEAAEHGWNCSFAGNLTYKKSDALREAARAVPDELLLVETDAPYLSPQAFRGTPNEPARVVATAERLAEERGISYAELDALVEANAARLFGW